jgi:gas vesicle protein
MHNDHTTEYVTAFVVGALLGAGAALLLAPDPPTRRDRIVKELKPYGKKIRKGAKRARKEAGHQAAAVGDWSEDLAKAGREVLKDLREEVADLVSDARDEIASAVENQVDSAAASLRRGTKRIRS